MVMDFLRSFHRRQCRIYADDGTPVTIRWFACAPGARPFPHLHAFGSTVWETDDMIRPELGEIDRAITWDKGTNPGYPGLRFQGLPEWYQDGIPRAVVDQYPWPPVICGRPTLFGFGGVEVGGAGTFAGGIIATGGVLVGGDALSPGGLFFAMGGAEVDGSALFATATDMEATGGVEVDGSVICDLCYDGTGGVEVDGLAEVGTTVAVFVGSGGVEVDGLAEVGTTVAVFVGSGGVEVDGSMLCDMCLDGTGGVEVDGEAEYGSDAGSLVGSGGVEVNSFAIKSFIRG